MRKHLLLCFVFLIALSTGSYAQEKCIAEIMFQEAAAENPSLIEQRQELENWIDQYIAAKKNSSSAEKSSQVPYIIPVVFHIVHYGGPENISRDQCVNQLETLTADFRRLNADTTNTPAAFLPVAADANIEFRMAQLDPNGNCTDGIVRIYSPLTYNTRNEVKALSYWPSDQYLNIWVVSSIRSSGSPGIVVGFAQFPGSGSATTDGVVFRSDFTGSIGTAASGNGMGRTATHEVGHWLNLRHIWGDATCGNDLVSDTPTQEEANLSICPPFPHITCGNGPNGDMYPNYMDYTNGNCQNIFSQGQAARMDATLNSSISGRINLWQQSNLIATGTDGTPAVLCPPVADFDSKKYFICEGGTVIFNDRSWNGTVDTRQWSFPGGSPSVDTIPNVSVTYATPGVYDVTLTVTNAAGSHTKTLPGAVIVSPAAAGATVPFNEGFESGMPANDWHFLNLNDGNTWQISPLAASTGSNSLYLNNLTGNTIGPDEFITSAIDLTNVTATTLTFDVAFAQTSLSQPAEDRLMVYISDNCGKTWVPRYNKAGANLATVSSAVVSPFTPNSSQWRTETLNLSSFNGDPNIRIRFQFTHAQGNNFYIDNINLNGNITGIDNINASNAEVSVYPNPSSDYRYLSFNMTVAGDVKIDVMDMSGRIVETFTDKLQSGEHQYMLDSKVEKGVYMVRMDFGGSIITKKVVIN